MDKSSIGTTIAACIDGIIVDDGSSGLSKCGKLED